VVVVVAGVGVGVDGSAIATSVPGLFSGVATEGTAFFTLLGCSTTFLTLRVGAAPCTVK
jgi:hypothetical protein